MGRGEAKAGEQARKIAVFSGKTLRGSEGNGMDQME